MAFSRRLGVVGILGASWLVAVACNDDGDNVKVVGTAGEGGEAPSGGKSTAGGSQNNGGKSPLAGSAGHAGAEGGGRGGVTGAAGNAGAGASTGGAAQAGSGGMSAGAEGGGGATSGGSGGAGGAAGASGASGASGSGGEGGTPAEVVAPHCSFSCTNDDDCLVDGDDTIKCSPIRHRCEDPSEACSIDDDCVVPLSGWFVPCTDDSSCTAGTQACVAAGGGGFCAKLPGAACTAPNVPKLLPRFGAQGTVQVCASADPRCFNNLCRPGCGDPAAACGQGNGDTCSAVDGRCKCTNGSECSAPGVCGRDGHCQECVINDDCAANVTDTVCTQGKCGCGAADACSNIDPGYASAPAQCQ